MEKGWGIVLICLIIVLIIAVGRLAYIKPVPKQYEIKDATPEPKDIRMGGSTTIAFTVINNNDKTTLVSKVEGIVNQTCFSQVYPKEIGELKPLTTIRTSISVSTVYRFSEERERCEGRTFDVILQLKDINGALLDSVNATIGIIQ